MINSLELAKRAAKILDSRKANDVKVLKIEELTVIADYFVIATGGSTTHVRSLADELEFKLKNDETDPIAPMSTEGYDSSSWVLLDYGSVVVHVFLEDARGFYALERLWGDAPQIELDFENGQN